MFAHTQLKETKKQKQNGDKDSMELHCPHSKTNRVRVIVGFEMLRLVLFCALIMFVS